MPDGVVYVDEDPSRPLAGRRYLRATTLFRCRGQHGHRPNRTPEPCVIVDADAPVPTVNVAQED